MSALSRATPQQLLAYNPGTGAFTWRNCQATQIRPGSPAGSTRKDGYVVIKVNGKPYKAHRLAFLYMTGRMPVEVDHRDRNPSNKRWSNLRAASHAENSRNRTYANSTGMPCVGKERSGRFRARVKVNGVRTQLGTYDTAEEAARAVTAAKQHLHGEFAA